MKEKHGNKHKRDKKHDRNREKAERNKERRRKRSSSSSNSESTASDEWVEKTSSKSTTIKTSVERDDWMSMTGMLKTYTKDDVRTKREDKDKKHIDSYNPALSSRELNPYWKDGGTGLPQTPEAFRNSKPFIKPTDDDDDDYYSKSSSGQPMTDRYTEKSNRYTDKSDRHTERSDRYTEKLNRYNEKSNRYTEKSDRYTESPNKQSSEKNYFGASYKKSNWKRGSEIAECSHTPQPIKEKKTESEVITTTNQKPIIENKYLSDEKMNKLAAKIVKAEIMGDTKLANELKIKLEMAREYRKKNPNAAEEEENDKVMLMSINSAGHSRPLVKTEGGDSRSKGGKRKAETYTSGQRTKYFGDDDKYNLAQMFQEEKYGNNYEDEAQLAKISAKHKNPNDDLEDIFVDEISKTRNEAKDRENERQKAINQHITMEKSLEGCEYCLDSKNMLKHLMVSCGNKVYLALPARKSLVKNQCIITTIQHSTCVTNLDEDVWDEIMTYRRALTQMFNSQNKDVVFFETATRLHRFPHLVINCVPLPRDVGDTAPIYFKKALLECEAEWSMNKKVVELKGKSIRKGVPKGLPYFWIDFGMDPGFAHVIEDQQLFPKTFAEETIAGILDLDHHFWKNPKKEYGDLQRKKVLDFIKEWKNFESLVKTE